MQESEGEATNVEAEAPRQKASLPVTILSGLGIIAAMYFARDLLIPLFFAILLALLLRPLFRRMQKLRLPDFVSAGILIFAVAVLILFGIFTLAGQAQGWLAHAPDTVVKVRKMLPMTSGPIGDLQKTTDAVKGLAQTETSERTVPVEVFTPDLALTVVGVSGHLLASVIIVFVVAFFLLALSDLLLKQAVESRILVLREKEHCPTCAECGIRSFALSPDRHAHQPRLRSVDCVDAVDPANSQSDPVGRNGDNPQLRAARRSIPVHAGSLLRRCSDARITQLWGPGCRLFRGDNVRRKLFRYSYDAKQVTATLTAGGHSFRTVLGLDVGNLRRFDGGPAAEAVAKIFCDQFEVTRPLSIILGEPEPRSRPQLEAPAVEPAKQAA